MAVSKNNRLVLENHAMSKYVSECQIRTIEAEAKAKKLLTAMKWTLDWLSSFSMPPTSTIKEKQEAMAVIEKAIKIAEGNQ